MNSNDTSFNNNNSFDNNNRDRKSTLLSSYLASDDDDDDDDIFTENKIDNLGRENERLEILATIPYPLNITNNNINNQRIIIDNNDSIFNTTSSSSATATTNSSDDNYLNVWNDNLIETATPRRSQYRVIFEIIKARTITHNESRQKFVNYTILMKRVPGLETEPAIIERRYSEFRSFYNSIRKRYPFLFKDIVFPKKIFIGNFSAEVIAERSSLFQKFLTYCLSIPEIRLSKEFKQFLYYPELRECKNCLRSIRLEEAASILENVYYIQSKLSSNNGHPDRQLIHTLCCLIGCLNAVDNQQDAKKLAEKTFEMLFENPIVYSFANNNNNNSSTITNNNNHIYEINNLFESSQLIIPLILLSLRHGWFYGQKKLLLEKKLDELCRKRSLPKNFDTHPKLLEILLRKDFSPII